MTQRFNAVHLICVAAALAATGSATAAPKCDKVASKVQADISARPERVLLVLEDNIVLSEACACEIIKAAIVASKAQPKLVGQIVFTAVTTHPAIAATAAECALSVAPDSASEIKKAVQKAIGDMPESEAAVVQASAPQPVPQATGKDPVGKNPAGKQPMGPDGTGIGPDGEGKPGLDGQDGSEADFGDALKNISGPFLFQASGAAPAAIPSSSTTRRVIRQPKGSHNPRPAPVTAPTGS